jgi:hypothetical protein
VIAIFEKTIIGAYALVMGVLALVPAYRATKKKVQCWRRERRHGVWKTVDPDSLDGSHSASG